MTSFRLRGAYFLITWAQLDTEHVTIFETLDNYCSIKRCIIAREIHQDGEPHFHAFVEFDRRLDRALSTQWDINGRHPNVKAKRSRGERNTASSYVRKDDDWIEFGDWDDDSNDTHDQSLLELVRQCGDFGAVIDLCYSESIPYALGKAAWNFIGSNPPRTWLDGERYAGIISNHDLLDLDWNEDEPPTSLIICGPAGIGKTSWAIDKAPKPLLVIKHIEDILHYRRDFHKALLFDDMSFVHMPRQQQLSLVDREQAVSLHLRHVVARIPEFVPRVFTCNPGFLPVDLADEAIKRRCTLFEIY